LFSQIGRVLQSITLELLEMSFPREMARSLVAMVRVEWAATVCHLWCLEAASWSSGLSHRVQRGVPNSLGLGGQCLPIGFNALRWGQPRQESAVGTFGFAENVRRFQATS